MVEGNYEKISDIGKGSFGVVSKIRRLSDGQVLVWKELNYGRMNEKEKQQLVSEVNILRELHHPNIVRYYDRIIDKEQTKIYIVMEYCERGDMAQMIKKYKKEKEFVQEEKLWKIIAQITSALYACHRKKEGSRILHRDLKPGNVFFDSAGNVKLGDFGLSRMMGDQSIYAYTHVGTPYYMSPEQISDQKYNEKSDIWSAGCVIYEYAALRAPFEATNQIQLAMKIKSGKIDRIPSHYSDELFKVIQSMMCLEQSRRPSVDDLMTHPNISMILKDQNYRELQQSIKKKEAQILKRDAELKIKEQAIKSEQDELFEREAKLKEFEERLRLRQTKLSERQTKLLIMQRQKEEVALKEQQQLRIEQAAAAEQEIIRGTQMPKRVKDESPRIQSRQMDHQRNTYNGSQGRRSSGNSQSRDAIPTTKDYSKALYSDQQIRQQKDIYRSNDNIQRGMNHYRSSDRLHSNQGTYQPSRLTPRKYEEEKKQQIGIPPSSASSRKSGATNVYSSKDYGIPGANDTAKSFSSKPPMMSKPPVTERPKTTFEYEENVNPNTVLQSFEAQRQKIASLRQQYQHHQSTSNIIKQPEYYSVASKVSQTRSSRDTKQPQVYQSHQTSLYTSPIRRPTTQASPGTGTSFSQDYYQRYHQSSQERIQAFRNQFYDTKQKAVAAHSRPQTASTQQYTQNGSGGYGSTSKSIRSALEEISQKIHSKYRA